MARWLQRVGGAVASRLGVRVMATASWGDVSADEGVAHRGADCARGWRVKVVTVPGSLDAKGVSYGVGTNRRGRQGEQGGSTE